MDIVLDTQIVQWILCYTLRYCNGSCVTHSDIAMDIE